MDCSKASFWEPRGDSAFEVDRRLLVAGRDYRFEARTGTLWLTRPLPSYNSDGTRNVLAVHCRTAEAGVGGSGSGARVMMGTGTASPVGTTWQRLGAGDVSTVGIDGSVPVGEGMSVAYKLASQTSDAGSGTAAQVEWQWHAAQATDVSAMVLNVDGTFSRTPGSSLAQGLEDRFKLDHRLDERLRVATAPGWIPPARRRCNWAPSGSFPTGNLSEPAAAWISGAR